MVEGARTPEELETLLEDAFVMRDRIELSALFDEGAVLGSRADEREARGGDAISQAVAHLWEGGRSYVGRGCRVLQARGLALVVADAGIHVARRGDDGGWRALITLLDLDGSTTREGT
jgi:hypothetical protein